MGRLVRIRRQWKKIREHGKPNLYMISIKITLATTISSSIINRLGLSNEIRGTGIFFYTTYVERSKNSVEWEVLLRRKDTHFTIYDHIQFLTYLYRVASHIVLNFGWLELLIAKFVKYVYIHIMRLVDAAHLNIEPGRPDSQLLYAPDVNKLFGTELVSILLTTVVKKIITTNLLYATNT